MVIPILTGLAAGGLHVFSGVDHLAALAPMAVEEPSQATRTGGYWGLGHGLGVVLIGGLGLWLRSLIDLQRWSSWAEFTVGFLLIGVGAWAVSRAGRIEVHDHTHEHDESTHTHVHTHGRKGRHNHHTAFGVGVFHGVAGSGHLFGVIPALALPTSQAILYLAAYLLAAVASMAAFARLLGYIARRGGSGSIKGLMYGSGALAIGVGVFWMITSWPV